MGMSDGKMINSVHRISGIVKEGKEVKKKKKLQACHEAILSYHSSS